MSTADNGHPSGATAAPRLVADRYELRGLIGRGGMAAVYLAHDLKLDRDVALKMLAEAYAADPVAAERFRREARTAAQITHPNVVAVFDYGEADGAPFMVMERVDGPDLRSYLRSHGPLPEREAVSLARQVAAALSAAHGRGLVHRDVKPGNILLDSSGRAKVADFGIARSASGASSATVDFARGGVADHAASPTAPTTVIGTAAYLAPELAQGQPGDARSDVYGLGVVLFQMLTGELPFRGDSPVAVALQHVQAPVPDLARLRPDLSRNTVRVVERALCKDPRDRFPTADAMAAALAASDRSAPAGVTAPDARPERVPPADAMAADGRPERSSPTGDSAAVGRPERNSPTGDSAAVGRPERVPPAGATAAVGRPERSSPAGATTAVGRPEPATAAALAPNAGGAPSPRVGARQSVRMAPGRARIGTPWLERAGLGALRRRPAAVAAAVAALPLIALAAWLVSGAVAAGPQVPAVAGRPLAEAQSVLDSRGFAYTVEQQPALETPAGVVVSQDPHENARAPSGSTVKLLVSAGMRVPNIVGRQCAEARAELAARGWTVKAVRWRLANQPDFGKIVAQDPPADAVARQASEIDVQVAGPVRPC